MHYWNKQNFEGLKSIAEKYSEIEDYKDFADFCHYMEIGLRKKAINSINLFVNKIKLWDTIRQRELADEIVSLQYFNQQIHQLSSYPLQQQLLNILEQWASDNNNNPIPNRWLGFLKHEAKYFRKALEFDPHDQICIISLAISHIEGVDFQMHHLSESVFLGDEAQSEKDLEMALGYIKRIQSEEKKSFYIKEFEETKIMFDLWKEYKASESLEEFPKWSKAKGHNYNFPSIVYYE